jgi:hypothetical protein
MNRNLSSPRALRQPIRRPRARTAFRPLVEGLEVRLAPAATDVLTWHNDLARTGQNLFETQLTPANVNVNTFGQLFQYAVDGYVYAQPLYKANLTIAGASHNVVFIATQHDSVYAFDADSPTAGPTHNGLYWQRSLLTPRSGFTVTTVPSPADTLSTDIVPEIGITATPVIDYNAATGTGTLFVVAKTKETETATGTAHWVQRIYAIDITTGADKVAPVLIGDTTLGGIDGGYTDTTPVVVPGTGDGSDGQGHVRFNALRSNERSGLVLSGGVVYVSYSSHGDNPPYHGWVIGYSATTLKQIVVFNTNPNGFDDAIWMSGAAPAVDAGGNLFFATGNGTFDAASGGQDYGDSILRLSTAGGLSVADYFTPNDQDSLSNQDLDQGSGGVLLLPDQPGPFPHLLVQVGKTGRIYLLNRDNLGQFTSTDQGAVEVLPDGTVGGMWSSPAYFNNGSQQLVYFHGTGDVLKAFEVKNGQLAPSVFAQGNINFGFPGATPSISANGTQNGIVWELDNTFYGAPGPGPNPAVLHAYDATTLSELYNSNQFGAIDQLGNAVKFTVPTVTNGHVYVGSQYLVSVFGLIPPATNLPLAPENLNATAVSPTSIKLTWTNDPTNERGVKVFRSVGNSSNFVQVAEVSRFMTSYVDKGLSPSTKYFYKLVSFNNVGDSPTLLKDTSL